MPSSSAVELDRPRDWVAAFRERTTERVNATTLGVAVLTVVGLVLRIAVVARPLGVVDRLFVPDDTYYTLTIARSLAHGHGPTTDGSTLTSGFQPLLGFLMTPVYWVTGSADHALRVDLVLLAVADVATIVVLAWVAYRVAGHVAALVAAAIWALSPVAITSAAGGLETSLAMLAAVALIAVWIGANDHPSTRRWLALGAVAGLAVLARIDLLLLVGLLGAVQLWRAPRRGLLPAALASAVVVGPWWIWCTVNLGTPFPTSGAATHALAAGGSLSSSTMSLAFGAVAGGPFVHLAHPRVWLEQHPGSGAALFWVAVVALLALGAAWLRVSTRGRRNLERAPDVAVVALIAFAAGLLVFYVWLGIPWYLSRYLAPIALVVTLLVAIACARVTQLRTAGLRKVTTGVLGAIVVVGLVASVVSDSSALSATARKPSLLDAATGFREPARAAVAFVPRGARVGGFQSGALGYYGGEHHTVVNLDGVVNPDAYRARRAGRTAAYIRSRDLSWLVDVKLFIDTLGRPEGGGHGTVPVRMVKDVGFVNGYRYAVARIIR